MKSVRARKGESGQAAVESAIVLPLQIFVILCLLQLIMIQHAKIMTEYAAYQAARAGIVWNGNNERMHDAALTALVPTMGDTSTIGRWAITLGKAHVYDFALTQLNFHGIKSFNGAQLMGQVRIDTINPSWWSNIGQFWKLASKGAASWKEMDFDMPDAYPEDPKLVSFIMGLIDPSYEDAQEENFRKATVLEIRIRYMYEMRIPFANWMIFTAWFASNANVPLRGRIYAPTISSPTANALSNNGSLPPVMTGKGIDHVRGYQTIYPLEMAILWSLARGNIPLLSGVVGKHYFLPLSATYSMRMQSNFHRRWLMHLNADWDSI